MWLRPFRDLVYTMPPYVTTDADVDRICTAIHRAVTVGMTQWAEWLAAQAAEREEAGLRRVAAPRGRPPTGSSTWPATTTSGSPATRSSRRLPPTPRCCGARARERPGW